MRVDNKTQADIGNAIFSGISTYLTTLGVGDRMKKARSLADKAWHMAYFDGSHTVHLIYGDRGVDVIDGDDPVPTGCKIIL